VTIPDIVNETKRASTIGSAMEMSPSERGKRTSHTVKSFGKAGLSQQ